MINKYAFISMRHRACLVTMPPKDFLALVGPPDRKTHGQMNASFKHFASLKTLEPLWLRITPQPEVEAWQVIDHDGRHRCLYLLALTRQKAVEVIVEPDRGDIDDFFESMMTKGLMCDDYAACGYSKHTINNLEGSDFTSKLSDYCFIKPLTGERI